MSEVQTNYDVAGVAPDTTAPAKPAQSDSNGTAKVDVTLQPRTIRLRYRPDVMTLNDMCTLEQPGSFNKVRDLLACHFVDADGLYIDDLEAAKEAVGNVPKEGIAELIREMWKQINAHRRNVADPN